jgi:hypothetical protein
MNGETFRAYIEQFVVPILNRNDIVAIDVTSGVNFTENHRFEFPHFAENVDLRRIGGGVCAFFCPTKLAGTCTLDRRPR